MDEGHRLRYSLARFECRLDLAQVDPDALHVYLRHIRTAENLNQTIGSQPGPGHRSDTTVLTRSRSRPEIQPESTPDH